VAVQPYALEYVDGQGAYHPAVDYVDSTTFVESLGMILQGTPIRARLACLAPIETGGAHRRELAQAAHAAVAAALHAKELPAGCANVR
jgi:1-acyl-sn-glycerol-3-phosphate acyltransferase